MRPLAPLALTLALVGLPAAALAQSPKDIAAARRAFKEGEEAEKQGDLRAALARFQEALEVKATPQLHLRIGAVQEKLGHLRDALASYQAGLEKAGSLPVVAKLAQEQIDAVKPRIPTVTIVVPKAPPGLKVTLDGAPIAASALGEPMPVELGLHQLHAEAEGFVPQDRQLRAAEKDTLRAEINLLAAEPSAPPPPPPEGSKLPGIVAVSAGGAALVAGLAVFVVSYTKDAAIDDLCGGSDRKRCPLSKKAAIQADVASANAFRAAGAIVGGLGLAGAAVGTVLLVRGREPAPTTGRGVQVVPAIGEGHVGLAAFGRF